MPSEVLRENSHGIMVWFVLQNRSNDALFKKTMSFDLFCCPANTPPAQKIIKICFLAEKITCYLLFFFSLLPVFF